MTKQSKQSKPSKAEGQVTVPIWLKFLTCPCPKNVPKKGRGLGPLMPIFLKKPYGAYAYLRKLKLVCYFLSMNVHFICSHSLK